MFVLLPTVLRRDGLLRFSSLWLPDMIALGGRHVSGIHHNFCLLLLFRGGAKGRGVGGWPAFYFENRGEVSHLRLLKSWGEAHGGREGVCGGRRGR